MLEEISYLGGGTILWSSTCQASTRQSIQRLLDDMETLLHLQHAHQVAVVDVAVGADRDLKVEALVAGVGEELAHIIGDAAATQRGAGTAELDGIVGGENGRCLWCGRARAGCW